MQGYRIAMVASEYERVPLECGDHDSEDDVAVLRSAKGPWTTGSKMLAIIAGIAMSGIAVVALVRHSSMEAVHAEVDDMDAFSQLSESGDCGVQEKACDELPQIKITKVEHSNLGKVTDPAGVEGLVYSGMNMHPGHESEEVLVVINATNAESVAESKTTGSIWGKYLGIAAHGGKFVHADFKIVNGATRDPVIIRELDITWFDLDKHADAKEVEYVRIKKPTNGLQYFLTKNTLVKVSEEGEYYKFTATKEGNAADNPSDPLLLTAEQKNKAVTIKFEDVSQFSVEVGSTGEAGGMRGFIFVFRPSLLCAQTIGGGKVPVCPGLTTTTTSTAVTTTTEGATTTTKEKECWFTIPVLNICVPKFLPFL